jgi:hypothetical protein
MMEADLAIKSVYLLFAIGCVFILIGAIFIPIAYRKMRADRAAMRWPQACASLESAEMAKHVRERPREEHAGLSVSYACLVTYRYKVNGVSYSAQHGLPASNAAHATELAAQQIAGAKRVIYYNPAHPEQYLIEPTSRYAALLWLLPCAAFGSFGLLLIWMAFSD